MAAACAWRASIVVWDEKHKNALIVCIYYTSSSHSISEQIGCYAEYFVRCTSTIGLAGLRVHTGTEIALSFPTHLNPVSCVCVEVGEKRIRDSYTYGHGNAQTNVFSSEFEQPDFSVFFSLSLSRAIVREKQCKRTIPMNEFVRAYNLIALFLSRWPLHTVSVSSGNSFVIFIRIHAQLLSLRRFFVFRLMTVRQWLRRRRRRKKTKHEQTVMISKIWLKSNLKSIKNAPRRFRRLQNWHAYPYYVCGTADSSWIVAVVSGFEWLRMQIIRIV